MRRVVVLGAGMVGSVIARDLAVPPPGEAPCEVTVVDRDLAALERASARCNGCVRTMQVDLSEFGAVMKLLAKYDAAAGALASHLGFTALNAALAARTPYCDISFMPEDAWDLDGAAREMETTAVVDFGVAPGMSNVLAAAGAAMLDDPREIDIMVGGLPVERHLPFQYKAGFAPADVIEEYVRPSRVVEGGEVVIREALSGIEPVDFPGVGTLEAFNTDGLRSLTQTLSVPNMRERTLRYPGHAALMHAFREAGFFSQELVDVPGGRVRPLDVTSRLLFPKWSYEAGEADLTAMRVDVCGFSGGKPRRLRWDLLDRFDSATGTTSMARTTAFPCTLMVRELLAGRVREAGVLTPERAVMDADVRERLLQGLAARGVRFEFSESSWDAQRR